MRRAREQWLQPTALNCFQITGTDDKRLAGAAHPATAGLDYLRMCPNRPAMPARAARRPFLDLRRGKARSLKMSDVDFNAANSPQEGEQHGGSFFRGALSLEQGHHVDHWPIGNAHRIAGAEAPA